MGFNELMALITSPAFIISFFGPSIINFSYWFLRGKLSRFLASDEESINTESEKNSPNFRRILLNFLNKNDFETVFAHSIQLMILVSGSVFLAVQIFTKCWWAPNFKARIESLWGVDWSFTILVIFILGYFVALALLFLNGEFATDQTISSYDPIKKKEKRQNKRGLKKLFLKVFPPINSVTIFRIILFVLIIYYNYWTNHHV